MDITKPRIYIEAIDNNGDRQNLSIPGWVDFTGKSEHRIRRDYKLKKNGVKLTNRQIAGLDEHNLSADQLKIKPTKSESERAETIKRHLGRCLV